MKRLFNPKSHSPVTFHHLICHLKVSTIKIKFQCFTSSQNETQTLAKSLIINKLHPNIISQNFPVFHQAQKKSLFRYNYGIKLKCHTSKKTRARKKNFFLCYIKLKLYLFISGTNKHPKHKRGTLLFFLNNNHNNFYSILTWKLTRDLLPSPDSNETLLLYYTDKTECDGYLRLCWFISGWGERENWGLKWMLFFKKVLRRWEGFKVCWNRFNHRIIPSNAPFLHEIEEKVFSVSTKSTLLTPRPSNMKSNTPNRKKYHS